MKEATNRLLILTDHSVHNPLNSIYELAQHLRHHPACRKVDVASRGIEENRDFFAGKKWGALRVSPVDKNFVFDKEGKAFLENWSYASPDNYDFILLRIPHPVSSAFLEFLIRHFPDEKFINRPSGIIKTRTKKFLLEVPELCPPMKLCKTAEDIEEFAGNYPIVLKPPIGYGGKGILKTDGSRVWSGDHEMSFSTFKKKLQKEPQEYLAMKFLQNVFQGDKRTLVVNGKVLGSSLRLPPENSWLCNVSLGGHSKYAEPDPEELEMAKALTEKLLPLGVVIFGFDTLVDDDGKRVLSEVNVLSIGGIVPMQQETGRPIVRQTADLMWEYLLSTVPAN